MLGILASAAAGVLAAAVVDAAARAPPGGGTAHHGERPVLIRATILEERQVLSRMCMSHPQPHARQCSGRTCSGHARQRLHASSPLGNGSRLGAQSQRPRSQGPARKRSKACQARNGIDSIETGASVAGRRAGRERPTHLRTMLSLNVAMPGNLSFCPMRSVSKNQVCARKHEVAVVCQKGNCAWADLFRISTWPGGREGGRFWGPGGAPAPRQDILHTPHAASDLAGSHLLHATISICLLGSTHSSHPAQLPSAARGENSPAMGKHSKNAGVMGSENLTYHERKALGFGTVSERLGKASLGRLERGKAGVRGVGTMPSQSGSQKPLALTHLAVTHSLTGVHGRFLRLQTDTAPGRGETGG